MLTKQDLDGRLITLGGIDHRITFVQNMHNSMSGELLGEIDHSKLILSIDVAVPDDLMLVVLLHECYHSMVEQTGTKFIKVRGHDEGFADRFAYFFANLMYDNPWLLLAIVGQEQQTYSAHITVGNSSTGNSK
jgi:hypothetical protein